MLRSLHRISAESPWQRQSLRFFARKSSIPNQNKKVITIPVIADNEIIRFKPAITVKDDLLQEGYTKEELQEDLLDRATDDDDIAIGNKASKAILKHAKVHHRHIERQPEWFREKTQAISDFRTLNQIQRLLKPWMVKTDVERINRYRFTPLGWGQKPTVPGKEAEDNEKNRLNAEQKYVYGPEETIVYASYHLPGRFSILERIFTDIRTVIPSFEPTSVLDFGCGPATGGAAAHSVWAVGNVQQKAKATPIRQYLGVDISQSMLDAARIMVKDILPNHLFFARSFDIVQRALKREERYSLIVCSYTLSELPTDAARQAAMQMLYELLDKDGIIVVVEHGDLYGSHTVRTARHQLQAMTQSLNTRGKFNLHSLDHKLPGHSSTNKSSKTSTSSSNNDKELAMMLPLLPGQFQNYADMGVRTLAPCTHDSVCPMFPGKKCTFMQRVAGSVIRKNAEEKFAYVVMQKISKSEYVQPLQHERKETEKEKTMQTSTQKTNSATISEPDSQNRSSKVVDIDELLAEVDAQKEGIDSIYEKTPLELMHIITSVGKNADKWTKRLKKHYDGSLTDKDSQEEEIMRQAEWLIESSQSEKWQEYEPKWKREEWARIISTPIKNDGHVIVDMCMPSGQLRRFTQPRSSLQMLPGLYTAVRKATLGGVLPIYFEGYERMMSAEENALLEAKQVEKEVNQKQKYQKQQQQKSSRTTSKNQKYFDDEDEYYNFEEDEEESVRDVVKRDGIDAAKERHRKNKVSKENARQIVDIEATDEPNNSTNKSKASKTPRRDDKDDGPMDAKTKQALEDFKKILSQQLLGPSSSINSTGSVRGRSRRNDIGGESAEEATSSENNSQDSVGGDKPRRGRRRPLY